MSEWDIFISYAHIDNQHYSDIPQGWIDYLQERLEIRLAQLLGRTPNIWRDRKKLRGNLDFQDEINDDLAKVAVFVSVLSPRYLESDSCQCRSRSVYACGGTARWYQTWQHASRLQSHQERGPTLAQLSNPLFHPHQIFLPYGVTRIVLYQTSTDHTCLFEMRQRLSVLVFSRQCIADLHITDRQIVLPLGIVRVCSAKRSSIVRLAVYAVRACSNCPGPSTRRPLVVADRQIALPRVLCGFAC